MRYKGVVLAVWDVRRVLGVDRIQVHARGKEGWGLWWVLKRIGGPWS